MRGTSVRCNWLTKTKGNTTMTPQDIAINVLPDPSNGSVNLPSWNQTMGGQDWNQWDS